MISGEVRAQTGRTALNVPGEPGDAQNDESKTETTP
jgi:hypothetical protein